MKRFTVRFTMAFVIGLAVALAALRDANVYWAGAMLLGSLLLFGVATLGSIHHREARRAWWLGFAIFQGGYFLIHLGGLAPYDPMPTSHFLDRLSRPTLAPMPPPAKGGGRAFLGSVFTTVVPPLLSVDDPDSFRRVGHCTFALLAGLLGATISCGFQRSAAEASGAA